ncbi:uncharacterized protein TM35_000181400 [Trypanosoma theileri]|uniref:Uncharacterized protein n=1 Tax=Trypanosoma theileri TaxID=67003 RepID=A0A1X0NUC4_9TRYP|nr:uncharacterized protein TM35_000181400 [Trypanosoma theileri]ORC88083.1 hypothetical protein TM35_000181400 [Trypanosoma theileri]
MSHVGTFSLICGLLLLILFGAISHVTASTLRIDPTVKRVFKLSVLNDSLVSREQVLCLTEATGTFVEEESLCPSGFGRTMRRMVYIKTQYPPGIFRVLKNSPTRFGVSFPLEECMRFKCNDDDDDYDSSSGGGDSDEEDYAYVVGLSVASPCCGSLYTSFTIDPSSLTMVQSSNIVLNDRGFLSTSFCALRQVSIEQLPLASVGIPFPARLFLCNEVVSTIVNEFTGRTITHLLRAVVSTNTAVTRMLFPREVLRAISGWISDGTSDISASLHDAGACVFLTTPYEHMACKIPPSLLNELPTMKMEVQGCRSRLVSNNYFWITLFDIDLKKLVDEDGFLRLGCSGSVSEALRRGAHDWEIPRIVLGALFLKDARISVTRNFADGVNARGIPIMVLASEKGERGRSPPTSDAYEVKGCAGRKTCEGKHVLFTSLNRCGMSPDCSDVISYRYDAETLECKLNVQVITSMSVLSVLVIISDVALLFLQRHVEKLTQTATNEMMQAKAK